MNQGCSLKSFYRWLKAKMAYLDYFPLCRSYFHVLFYFVIIISIKYSQTCVNDHLWITTTFLQRPAGTCLNDIITSNITSLTTTSEQWPVFLGPKGGHLYSGLTVLIFWPFFVFRAWLFFEHESSLFPDQSHPLGPLVECSFLPREFIECNEPVDHKGNATAKQVST
jgi:hypothetical protein